MNPVPRLREVYDELFQESYRASIDIVTHLFNANGNFRDDPAPRICEVTARFGNFRLKQRNIIHKYYLNVTIGRFVYPFRHLVQFLQAGAFLGIRRKATRKIILKYADRYFERIERIQPRIPEIDLNQFHHQIFKVIMALVLNTFINQPVWRRRKHYEELDQAFLAGFVVGISYAVSDISLDSDLLSAEEKGEFNELILNALAGETCETASTHNILKFVPWFKNEADTFFPKEHFAYTYKVLYLLERAQYEEMSLPAELDSTGKIIRKTALLALKTQFSLMVMRLSEEDDVIREVKSGLLYSLYVQLDDDLEDEYRDRLANAQTLFTATFRPDLFNPHALMLSLIGQLSRKYRAGWMYGEFLQHLERNRDHRDRTLDDDKINLFVRHVTHFTISELMEMQHHRHF